MEGGWLRPARLFTQLVVGPRAFALNAALSCCSSSLVCPFECAPCGCDVALRSMQMVLKRGGVLVVCTLSVSTQVWSNSYTLPTLQGDWHVFVSHIHGVFVCSRVFTTWGFLTAEYVTELTSFVAELAVVFPQWLATGRLVDSIFGYLVTVIVWLSFAASSRLIAATNSPDLQAPCTLQVWHPRVACWWLTGHTGMSKVQGGHTGTSYLHG